MTLSLLLLQALTFKGMIIKTNDIIIDIEDTSYSAKLHSLYKKDFLT